MPEIYKELDMLQTKLENHYKDMQDMGLPFRKVSFGSFRRVMVNVPVQLW